MQDKIGTLAGAIWRLLQDSGEQKLSSLPKLLDQKAADVHMAIGWLARESNVTFSEKKGAIYVALSGS